MSCSLVWPDYTNCIANLPNSILKYFGAEPVGDTLPLLDKELEEKEYKNVVVLLLDGMGKCILERYLDETGSFRSHLAGIYNSVFLSTTVAATTSVLSGLQPCEHSWLGWECYYPQIDKNVTVFRNTLQGTDEPAADFDVARTFTPYKDIIHTLLESGQQAHFVADFMPSRPHSIEDICENIQRLCGEPGRKYIYAYWGDPDGLLHKFGGDSEKPKDALRHMEAVVSRMAEQLEDTLLIVTADHGHIDNDYVVLQDYPKLLDCLERMPSLEARVLNLFVKEGMEQIFEEEFNREFGGSFMLMPMEEALERKLFGTGTPHRCFRGMLGNYLAIATDTLSIFYNKERWKSMHGSITEQEMRIPLILYKK